MLKYIFIIQCLGLKCNLIYLLDFGRFNTLFAISFWLQKAKKDTAAIVNAGLGIGTFFLQKKLRPPRLWAGRNYKRQVAKSKHRKIYINVYPIVHSLNLRSPLFRIDWCGNDNPRPRRNFQSSRRSGSVLVLFCYRKRTKPPRLWAEENHEWN